jgi:hypothetical protein
LINDSKAIIFTRLYLALVSFFLIKYTNQFRGVGMKRTTLLCLTVLIAIVAISWRATTSHAAVSPLLFEDFSYPTGDLITAHGWQAHSAGGTNAITITSPGLTYSGYNGSGVGNAVSLTTSGEDDNRVFPSQTSGTVYMSALVNVSAASTTGDYFIHFAQNPVGTIFNGRVFVKSDGAGGILFGITKANGTAAYTSTSFALNTTYLVVVRYTIVAGATNDTAELYVNPDITASAPPASPSATAGDVATAADPASIGAVALRQGTGSSSPTVRVDGIRVGTTWGSLNAFPKANVDMNGDGRSDFVVVRGTGSAFTASSGAASDPKLSLTYRDRRRTQLQNSTASGAQAYWYVALNGPGTGYGVPWGDATIDTALSEDFDGDGKDDIAVWRPGSPGAFYIIYSQTNTGAVFFLGSTFDDPTVTGDYDGDGKADVAVYSCPDPGGPDGTCFYKYIGSKNNPGQTVTEVSWGVGVAFQYAPAPGDYDGDGKLDFCIRRDQPGSPGQAQYALMRSSDFGQEQISWGLMTDFNEPGDYDGDGKSDFMAARNNSGNLDHYLLTRTGNVSIVQWGIASDAPSPGDYDGDGKTDISVYRPANLPSSSTFYSLSLSKGFISAVQWGACLTPCDAPAASWNVQ